MPQSLIRMPQTAGFDIGGLEIHIWNHEVDDEIGLFGKIIWIVNEIDLGSESLNEFEKHGISFEAAIEECARELEGDTEIFEHFIVWQCDIDDLDDQTVNFSESTAGRKIAEQYIEKIRSCDNWGELYDELHHTSRFQQEMYDKMSTELEQCLKV